MKKIFRWAIPFLLMVGGIGFMLAYDFYLQPMLNTEEVIVLNKNIAFADEITSSDLSIQKVNKDHVVEGALRRDQLDLVLNKRASIDLASGTQINKSLIDSYNLVPDTNKGEFIAPIPESWLFAVPGTLRKAFVADFYAISDGEAVDIEQLIKDSEELGGKASSEEGNEKENESLIKDTEEVSNAVEKTQDPILENVRVASVRDRSNSEVITTDDQTESGSGSIAELEIVADEEKLETIQRYVDKGYKLYVVYQFNMEDTQDEEGEQ
ncbi:SAF domain-containing protein [Halobacillus locisalis]|uniref:SAF domain-containing protein n=1 Tax=Halobacillus locisalis TaxID=220753 RepID=A0A838CZS2_9BACI|nr:SAF domain-containing protein [Halobacillus locisalis]MBA2176826.1 SAF domain-containing protein [Halobacillus locisalis]